jgi:cytochrome c-type biogenesis protein CcmE
MTTVWRSGRGLALAAGLVVVLGGFGYLLYGGIGENLVYFLTPRELLAKGDRAYDAPVRLGGMVVPGSVQWNADAVDLRFRLTDGNAEVLVHSRGAPPQMFRDSIGVVVEGTYGRDGVFQSKNLMVKHSNEYHPPKEGQKPAQVYSPLVKERGT